MSLGDVVDQFLNDDGLADARAAKEADLSALHERRDEVDDLDPGLEDLRLRLQRDEIGTLAMNRPARRARRNRRAIVHRLAENVQDAPQRGSANRNGDRTSGVHDIHAADDAVRARHRDRAHLVAPNVLLHLDRNANVGA